LIIIIIILVRACVRVFWCICIFASKETY
jgi:hypothetical protein